MKLKSELYASEQKEIVYKIIDIINLDTNNSITLYELDNNVDKQQKLLELLPDIRKYFAFGNIRPLSNPTKFKRTYLSLIRNITKNEYTMKRKDFSFTLDGKKIRTQKYTFSKL